MIDLASLLRFAAPVAFAATGETVGQKSGVINVGLEGLMLASAFAAAAVSGLAGSAWIGLGAGVAAGIVLNLVQAWFVVRLSVDQVVAGTAVNLFALGVTSALFRPVFGTSGELPSVPSLPDWQGFATPVLSFERFDLLLVLLPLAVAGAGYMLYRTGWGLALRAAGENPIAAEAAGFSVTVLRVQAMAIGGLLAGIAGAYLAVGVNNSFAENMTAGRGFVAIAMVTFGRWRPVWVLLASLLIGYAESLQFTLQAKGVGVPHELLVAAPYVLALLVLVIAGKGTAAPSALSLPYRREQ